MIKPSKLPRFAREPIEPTHYPKESEQPLADNSPLPRRRPVADQAVVSDAPVGSNQSEVTLNQAVERNPSEKTSIISNAESRLLPEKREKPVKPKKPRESVSPLSKQQRFNLIDESMHATVNRHMEADQIVTPVHATVNRYMEADQIVTPVQATENRHMEADQIVTPVAGHENSNRDNPLVQVMLSYEESSPSSAFSANRKENIQPYGGIDSAGGEFSPAARREKSPSTSPTVKVTIGRIDVRAVHNDPPQPIQRSKTPYRPTLSLDNYLQQRRRGER